MFCLHLYIGYGHNDVKNKNILEQEMCVYLQVDTDLTNNM